MSDEGIRDLVKQKYGQAALRVVSGETSCCGRAKLAKAGFEHIDVEPTRIYTAESASDYIAGAGLSAEAIASIDGKFISAFVRADTPLR